MEIVLSIVLTLIGILVGIAATAVYGSNYLPRRKGKAIEKYMVTDIYDFRVKGGTHHLARIQLVRSSVKNACGFADLLINPTGVEFLHYAFANNCFHNIIAPGKILIDDNVATMRAQSNRFASISMAKDESSIPNELIPKKFRRRALECMLVSIDYTFPPTYTGPMYKSKKLLFAKGVGLVSSVTEYANPLQKDVFALKRFKIKSPSQSWWPVEESGNYWVYEIEYCVGPNRVNLQE